MMGWTVMYAKICISRNDI